MAYDTLHKYRVTLSDGRRLVVSYGRDDGCFPLWIDQCKRLDKQIEGTTDDGKKVLFNAKYITEFQYINSGQPNGTRQGVRDRRDGEFYRTIRCGQFYYEGQLYELEWLAEDLRYESHKLNQHRLGVPTKHGGGRVYSLEDLDRWNNTYPARTEGCDTYFVPFHGMHLIADSDADGVEEAEKELAEFKDAVKKAYAETGKGIDAMNASRDPLNTGWGAAGLPASDLATLNAIMRQLDSQADELADTEDRLGQGGIHIWDILSMIETAQKTLNIARDEAGKLSGKLISIAGAIADAIDAKHYAGSAQGRLEEALKKLDAEPLDAEGAKTDLKDAVSHLVNAITRVDAIITRLNGTNGALYDMKENKLMPAQTLLTKTKAAVEQAIEKLGEEPDMARKALDGTAKYLDNANDYLDESVNGDGEIMGLSDIQASVSNLISKLINALLILDNNLATLIKALKELYDNQDTAKNLKAKRYYSPERGWRMPRETDIALLVGWILGTAKLSEYNKDIKIKNTSDPGLSKLLSETWPYYGANGKPALWPNRKRIGFDAVAHRQSGTETACDFWALQKIERVEKDIDGKKVIKYEYTYGYFTISTAKGSDMVKVEYNRFPSSKRIPMRLCRAVLKEE